MARNTVTTSISFSPDISKAVSNEMRLRKNADLGPRASCRSQVVNDICRVALGRTPCVPLYSRKAAKRG